MKLNYIDQLNKMRRRYRIFPIRKIDAKKPNWLIGNDNVLNEIYDNPMKLLKDSNINYGCILQANTLLFDKNDKQDCPATFITSDSEYILIIIQKYYVHWLMIYINIKIQIWKKFHNI